MKRIDHSLKTPLMIALESPRGIVWAGKQVDHRGIVTHKINGSECMALVRLGWLALTYDIDGKRCYRLTNECRQVAEKQTERATRGEGDSQ